MRFLATLIMRGRLQAVLVTAATALLLPGPLAYVSSAAVALVTLVQGPREGVLNALGAGVLVGLAAQLVAGSPLAAVDYALLIWLPAWLLAYVLRQTTWLSWALLGGVGLAMVVVVAAYVVLGDPAAVWQEFAEKVWIPALQQAGMDVAMTADFKAALAQASQVMTGTMAAFASLGLNLALLLARWWQSVLYRPGAFRDEFHALRFGRMAAGIAAIVLGLAVVAPDGAATVAANLLLVCASAFLLQGLAVAHDVVQRTRASVGWLVGLYVMLVLTLASMALGVWLLALIGWVDNWLDLRRRVAVRS